MLDKQLADIIATGKISHSWLITGEEKLLLEQAQLLAQALLCQDLGADGIPCGMCFNCQKVENGNHPDLQIIMPDGASVKIHQTRKMQHFANLESYEGGRQVVIIHHAHTMQVAAANSLLKILEEPPKGTYFILTAPVGDSLLQTILSRVVWVRLNGGENSAETNDNELKKEMLVKAKEFLNILSGDLGTALVFAGSFKEDKKRSLTVKKQTICFLEQLLLCIREMIAMEYLPESRLLPNENIKTVFKGQNALLAAGLVEDYIRMASANVNNNLLLNVLSFKLQELCQP